MGYLIGVNPILVYFHSGDSNKYRQTNFDQGFACRTYHKNMYYERSTM